MAWLVGARHGQIGLGSATADHLLHLVARRHAEVAGAGACAREDVAVLHCAAMARLVLVGVRGEAAIVVHVRHHLQVVALHGDDVAAVELLEAKLHVGGAALVEAVVAPHVHGLVVSAAVAAERVQQVAIVVVDVRRVDGSDPLEHDPAAAVLVVVDRHAQRPPPVVGGLYGSVDGVEQLLRLLHGVDAVQRLVPAVEAVGPGLAHAGELGLLLAQLGEEVVPERVPRARLRVELPVPRQHALLGLPHVRLRLGRGRPRAAFAVCRGDDERDLDAAEHGELVRLLLEPLLPLAERGGPHAAVRDEPHGNLAAAHCERCR